ncbi:integrase/recombinase xerD homolog [Paroedura picta]|uniref:integrase/recombinase xerD homolog n=1 Tax=Paroedura picta TaxID=143630 RepID=UPI004057B426
MSSKGTRRRKRQAKVSNKRRCSSRRSSLSGRKVSPARPGGKPGTRDVSRRPVVPWRRMIIDGVLSSLSESTRRSYERAAKAFLGFAKRARMRSAWPLDEDSALCFLAHLRGKGLSHKSLRVMLSGLAFISKALGGWDPAMSFLARQAVKGWGRQSPRTTDARRPITLSLLVKMVKELPLVWFSKYEAVLFQAAFCLAFHGAFQISELVAPSCSPVEPSGLGIKDVAPDDSGVFCSIRKSKCDQKGRGDSVYLLAMARSPACPLSSLQRYLMVRPHLPGTLFIHADPVFLSRFQFVAIMRACMARLGLPTECYGSHSFRIGATTEAYTSGKSVRSIKRLGRWKSQAYKLYIRPEEHTNM